MGLRKMKHCSSRALMLLCLALLPVEVLMEQEVMPVFFQASLIRMLLTAHFSTSALGTLPCTWFLIEFQSNPGL